MHPFLGLLLSLPPTLKVLLIVPITILSISILSSSIYLFIQIYGYRLRSTNERRRRIALNSIGIVERDDEERRRIVGLFHPYCNAGGGGERVLWTAVACLQREEPELIVVIYTGDLTPRSELGKESVTKQSMIKKVKDRFGISLKSETLIFVALKSRHLVEDTTWRRFTLLGQSLGSVYLAWEGLSTGGLIPDIWIDTMGYAFAYPLVRHLCRIPVGSYTHYPTISTDMLRRVSERKEGHTNKGFVARSAVLTQLKLMYYLIFAELYSFCLRQSTVLMVNSTWTKNHIDHLLKPFGYRDDADFVEEEAKIVEGATSSALANETSLRSRQSALSESTPVSPSLDKRRFRRSKIVYPPCDTISLSELALEPREEHLVLSLAQFRPEKDHPLQLQSIAHLVSSQPQFRPTLKLVLAGSVRHASDEARVDSLRKLASSLGIEANVSFVLNADYKILKKDYLGRASVGLHTMVDEHFGITVVEFMAAGLIPLVHASAGPLLDIVTPLKSGQPTGFHARTVEEFSSKLGMILELSEEQKKGFRERARKKAHEFGNEGFEKGWLDGWRELSRAS